MSKTRGTEFRPLQLSIPNLTNWSLDRVRRALDQHEAGNFSNSAWLWDSLDRNPRSNAAMNRRILTVLGLPTKLESGSGDGRKNASALNKIKPYWAKMAPRSVNAKLLRNGIGMGVAFGQRVWRPVGGDLIPKIQIWHSSFFSWYEPERAYQVQTQSGLQLFRPGDGSEWVVFSYDEWDSQPWMRGVMRAIGLSDSVRSYAVRDWARYSEVHGIPMRMLHVPFGEGDTEEKEQIVQQVENPGTDITVIVPKGKTEQDNYSLELVEPTDRSWESFDRLKKAMDTDVALAITGTEVLNESGVYNPKDNSQGVRQDYLEADAAALSDFNQNELSRPWARINLGADFEDSAPRSCIDSTPPMDKEKMAQTINTLGQGLAKMNEELRRIGKEVDPLYLEQFGIPIRDTEVKALADIAASKPTPAPGSPPAA